MLADHSNPARSLSDRVGTVRKATTLCNLALSKEHVSLAESQGFLKACEAIIRIRSEANLGENNSDAFRVRHAKAEDAFKFFVTVWRDRVRGDSIRTLAKRYGPKVRSWFYELGVPRELSYTDPVSRAGNVDVAASFPGTSSKVAFFLGVLASKVWPRFSGRSIQLRSNDSDAQDALRTNLTDLQKSLGITINKEPPTGQVVVVGYALSNYFFSVTNSNTTLPWAHLSTAEERRAFLRSFVIYSRITVNADRPIIIQRRHLGSLLEELTALLLKEGIISSFAVNAGGGVVIVSDAFSRHRLVKIVAGAGYQDLMPSNSTRQAYLRALQLKRSTESLSEIQSRLKQELNLSINRGTIHGWLNGTVPTVVQNEEFALSIARELHKKWDLRSIGARWAHDFHADMSITAHHLYRRVLELFGSLEELALAEPRVMSIAARMGASAGRPSDRDLVDVLMQFGIYLSAKDLKRG